MILSHSETGAKQLFSHLLALISFLFDNYSCKAIFQINLKFFGIYANNTKPEKNTDKQEDQDKTTQQKMSVAKIKNNYSNIYFVLIIKTWHKIAGNLPQCMQCTTKIIHLLNFVISFKFYEKIVVLWL